MESAIENMKAYFHSEGMGLKKSYLNKSPELQSLLYALSLYTLSTGMSIYSGWLNIKCIDNLIKRFMESSIEKEMESYGEVNLLIELKQNPGMDKQLNVKIIAATNLVYRAASFRPYISLDIIGPGLSNFKRNAATKSMANQWSPKFNQQFRFLPLSLTLIIFVSSVFHCHQQKTFGIICSKSLVKTTASCPPIK